MHYSCSHGVAQATQKLNKIKPKFAALLVAVLFLFTSVATGLGPFVQNAFATPTQQAYYQGFETDTSGWTGSVTRVASGTQGMQASEGNYYAEMTGQGYGPYSFFDDARDAWTGGYTTNIDVYLDPSWNAGSGFDYSVASSGSDGNHQRDFVFHVAKDADTNQLLVAGDNNAYVNPATENFEVDPNLENKANNYAVTQAGWYTLQHVFRNDNGVLAVDLNLLDSNGDVVWTETRENPSDTIPAEVGGNYYAWFTTINVSNGLAVDAQELTITDHTSYSYDESDSYFKGSPQYVRANNSGDVAAQVIVPTETTDVRFDFNGPTVVGNVAGYEKGTPGEWRAGVAAPGGQYTVTAEYKVGNEWNDVTGSGIMYSIDNPTAEYVTPNNDRHYFRSSDNPVRLKVEDEFRQFDYMVVTIDGVDYKVEREQCDDRQAGRYLLCDVENSSSWASLAPGKYTASTATHTIANNRVDNLESRQFTIDGTAPTLEELSLQSHGSQPVSGNVIVQAKASDNEGVANVKFYYAAPRDDGSCDPTEAVLQTITVSGKINGYYTAEFNTSELNGDYCFFAIVEDVANAHSNPQSHKLRVAFDNKGPNVLSVTYAERNSNDPISNGGFTDEQKFTFVLSADGDPVRWQLEYWNDIEGSDFNGRDNAWNPTDLAAKGKMDQLGTYMDKFTQGEGTHYFAFSGCDAVGNCSEFTEPFAVTYDNTAPVVTNLRIMQNGDDISGDVTNQRYITVQWSDSNDSNFDYFEYENANGWQPLGSTSEFSGDIGGSNGSDGKYTYRVRAYDKAGNVSEVKAVSVTLDTTVPTVIDNFTVEMQTGDKVMLAPTATDDSSVIYDWVASDSTLVVPGQQTDTNNGTLTVGPAAPGNYTVDLTVTDAAGNETVVTYNVTINTPDNGGRGGNQRVLGANDTRSDNDFLGLQSSQASVVANLTSGNDDDEKDQTAGNQDGEVKGEGATNLNVNNKDKQASTSGAFLGLGWWWVPILVALLAFFFAIFRQASTNSKTS